MSAPLAARLLAALGLGQGRSPVVPGARGDASRMLPLERQLNLEGLEARAYFTTIVGGDVFEYQDAGGNTVRVAASGNIVAELIGGSLTPSGTGVNINDVPGHFYASTVGRNGTDYLGGVGGARGIQLLGNVNLFDPLVPLGSSTYDPAGRTTYTPRSIATDAQGNMFGFNVVAITDSTTNLTRNLVQLLKYDKDGSTTGTPGTATVIAELDLHIPVTTGLFVQPKSNFLATDGLTDVSAAAFNPIDGRLYFVLRGTSGTGPGQNPPPAVPTQQLFSVNVNAGNAGAITASVTAFTGSFNRSSNKETSVTALVWDQTAAATAQLYAFYTDTFNAALRGSIIRVNLGNTDILNNQTTVTYGASATTAGTAVSAVTGLTIVNDNPIGIDTVFYATESASSGGVVVNSSVGPQVLKITLPVIGGNATAVGYGQLQDPAPATGSATAGLDIGDLTYNPVLTDPFTGKLGALVAVDATSDQVLYVDQRQRFPSTNVFNLYISSADSTGQIVIGQVAKFDPTNPTLPRPMQPFTGAVGPLQVRSAQDGTLISVNAPAGSGSVYVGIKTNVTTDPTQTNIPRIAGVIATQLGTATAGNVVAGVVSSLSLLQSLDNNLTVSQRLMGQNVSGINALTVDASGNVFGLDNDGVDANRNINGTSRNGTVISVPPQLVTLNPSTGQVIGTPISVVNSGTATLLASQGLVSAKLAGQSSEQLLAVFASKVLTGNVTLPNNGTGINISNTSAPGSVTLTVADNGLSGFILADSGPDRVLYRFDRASTSVNAVVNFTLLGKLQDTSGNTISGAAALGLAPNGTLYTVGLNTDNPLPTTSVGGTAAVPAGATISNVTVARDGNIYAVVNTGSSIQIRQLVRDAQGSLTGFGAINTITVNGTNVQGIKAVTPTGTNLLAVGPSVGSQLPNTASGPISDSNGLSNFQYRGVTATSSGATYAIVTNGATLQLRGITLTQGGTAAAGGFTDLGEILYDPSGTGATAKTAVLGITATDSPKGDALNAIYGIGTSADQLAPNIRVSGTLGASGAPGTVPVSLVLDNGDNPTYIFKSGVNTTYYGFSYTGYGVNSAQRDIGTGGILGTGSESLLLGMQEFVGSNPALTTNATFVANDIVDTRAISNSPFGARRDFTGWNPTTPAVTAPLPGDLGSSLETGDLANVNASYNIRALVTQAVPVRANPAVSAGYEDFFAAQNDSNNLTELLRIKRDQTTGGVVPIASGGVIRLTNASGDAVLRDPTRADPDGNVGGAPILFVYALAVDATVTGNSQKFYFVGASDPGTTPTMTLYSVTLTGNTLGAVSKIASLTTSNIVKGLVYTKTFFGGTPALAAILDDGGPVGAGNDTPASVLMQITLAGVPTLLGAAVGGDVGVTVAPATIPPASQASTLNTDIRSLAVRKNAAGAEVLVGYDILNGGRLLQFDAASVATPILTTVSGTNTLKNPFSTVLGIQGTYGNAGNTVRPMDNQFRTYTIDQYGRSYAFRAGATASDADRIWVSGNNFYDYDFADTDGDNFDSNPHQAGELRTLGRLINSDGTAFTDSIVAFTPIKRALWADQNIAEFWAVAQRINPDAISPAHPITIGGTTFEAQRLVKITTVFSGGLVQGSDFTVTPANATNGGAIEVLNDTYKASNITGIALTDNGNTIAGDLLAIDAADPTSTTDSRMLSINTTDPTLTRAITDSTKTVLSSAPAGLAIDSKNRFYSADGSAASVAAGTYLDISGSNRTVFKISTGNGSAAGTATNLFPNDANGKVFLGDPSLSQQRPNVLNFTAVAFTPDGSALYAVEVEPQTTTVNNITTTVLVNKIGIVNLTTGDFNLIGSGVLQTTTGVPVSVTAMDFAADGSLIGLDAATGRQVQLLTLPAVAGSPQNVSYISPAGSTFGLAGMSYNRLGQFVSIDTSTDPDTLVVSPNALTVYNFSPLTGLTTVVSALTIGGLPVNALSTVNAMATSSTGIIYAIIGIYDPTTGNSTDSLYTINPATGVATVVGAGATAGAVTLTQNAANGVISPAKATKIIALGFSLAGDLIGLDDPTAALGDRRLVRINLVNPSLSRVVPGSTTGSVDDALVSIAADAPTVTPTGLFYGLSVTNGAATLTVTPQTLYKFNNSSLTGSGLLSPVGALIDTGRAFTGQIVAGDYSNANTTPAGVLFYGVARTAITGTGVTDFLVTIGTTAVGSGSSAGVSLTTIGGIIVTRAAAASLDGTTIPAITVAQPAAVSALSFQPDGSLRARDESQSGGTRLIGITVNLPQQSVALTSVGIASGYAGYDTDAAGTAYSQYIVSNPDTLGIDNSNSGVFTGGGGSSGGGVGATGSGTATFGSIVVAGGTATFTAIGTGAIGSGADLVTTVLAMAWDRLTSRLYVIDQNNKLKQIDPTTGAVLATVGTVKDAGSGATLTITSMAFDGTGRLIGQDSGNGRAVDISISSAIAGGVIATANRSLRPTVGAIGYNPVTNLFLASDNATGYGYTGITRNNAQRATTDQSGVLYKFSTGLSTTSTDIGKIAIGGTVTGEVDLNGSVNTFYAGWVVTGTVNGLGETTNNPLPGNFRVHGDLNQLVTPSAVGTDGLGVFNAPTYRTGTDLKIDGRLGVLQTNGRIMAGVKAANSQPTNSLSGSVNEVETKVTVTSTLDQAIGNTFQSTGDLFDSRFNNDSIGTGQFLGTLSFNNGSSTGTATVNGTLLPVTLGDVLDYYRVGIRGGQPFTVNLNARASVGYGVYDPQGRLVASSYTKAPGSATFGAAYVGNRITPVTPGVYTIVVAQRGDTNFNGVLDTGESVVTANTAYTLNVSGLGDEAIGAIATQESIFDPTVGSTGTQIDYRGSFFDAQAGDIGAIYAIQNIGGNRNAINPMITAESGSINAISGGTLGFLDNGFEVNAATFAAPSGTVGAVVARTDFVLVNPFTAVDAAGSPVYLAGKDIQLVSAATDFAGSLTANGNIGTIRAGSMTTPNARLIVANANNDNIGGTIDLIDVTGSIGGGTSVGPDIFTNRNGNVRYMNVGGSIDRSTFYGGQTIDTTILPVGQGLTFIDDSGSRINIGFESRYLTKNPAYNGGGNGQPEFSAGPSISYRAFPIDSGGSVLVNLNINNADFTNTLTSSNVVPMTTIASSGGAAEIGVVTLNNVSTALEAVTVTAGTSTNAATSAFIIPSTLTQTPDGRRNDILLTGDSPLDVFNIRSLDASGTVTHITSLTNQTKGELLNLNAVDIGTLSYGGGLGVARKGSTGLAPLPNYVVGTNTVDNSYPFVQQANLIQARNVISASSNRGLGNLAFTGTVGTITANADGQDDGSVFEGVAAPIVITGAGAQLGTLNIGEGIATVGTGYVGGGVVLVDGLIDTVQGPGDVRGTIAGNIINRVSIGGSFIGATVESAVLTTGAQRLATSELPAGDPTFFASNFVTNRFYGLGRVSTGNNGGIIGSILGAGDIQQIATGDKGFGIINSDIQAFGGQGIIDTIRAGGYGIRGTIINTGYLNNLAATGNGSNLSTATLSPSVRHSEYESFDSSTGLTVSDATDIHIALKTSAQSPVINGVTTTGVIEDVTATGQNNLGSVSAYTIRGSYPVATDTQPRTVTTFSFGQRIGSVKTTSSINGMDITGATLGSLTPGKDLNNSNIVISGPLNNLHIKGNVGGTSLISSVGSNASIKNLTVDKNFSGRIESKGNVNGLTIGGNLTGSINITAGRGSSTALDNAKINGSMTNGSLKVLGNIGSLTFAKSLGANPTTTGGVRDTFSVTGNVKNLTVGTSTGTKGKAIFSAVNIGGTLTNLTVGGYIDGPVTVTKSIGTVKVTADKGSNGNLIRTSLTSTNSDISSLTLSGGGVSSNATVSAGGQIKTVSISGSVGTGATISSRLGNIGTVSIGGSLNGNIRAGSSGNKSIGTLKVSGNMGDGKTAATVKAAKITTATFNKSVFSLSSITASGTIDTLTIKKELQKNATVTAAAINHLYIGKKSGTVTIG